MNIQPLYDRIIVKYEDPKETTDGGIYLPNQTQQHNEQFQQTEGVAIAVGDGYPTDDPQVVRPLRVTVGDNIKFTAWQLLEYEGEKILIVRESDVVGIIKE